MDLPTESPPHTDTASPGASAPPRVPGPWGGIAMVVLYFLLQLAVGLLVGIVLAIGYVTMGTAQGHGAETAMDWLQAPSGKVVLTIVTLPIVAAVMLWMIRHRWRAQWSLARPPGLGFTAPPNGWFYLLAIIVAGGWAVGGALLTQLLAHGHAVQQDVTVMGSQVSFGMHLLLAVVVVCVAPVVEEALFRGVLLSGFMRVMPAAWAVVASAVIFGGVHYPDFGFAWYPLPTLMVFGALLGWIRLESRSLWPAIVLHATNNLIAVTAEWIILARGHG